MCGLGDEISGRWSQLASGRSTGYLCIEKCMGGIGVVALSEWSPIKSGRMDKFDCIGSRGLECSPNL